MSPLRFARFIATFTTLSAPQAALADGDNVCATGLAAYAATVHPLVVENCQMCHGGSRPIPAFATDDAEQSYFRIANFVDFRNLDASILRIRAGNGHCRVDNCNADAGVAMADMLAAWWDQGEQECNRFGRFFSLEQQLPTPLPSGDGYREMTWDLSGISMSLRNVSLTLEVQRFSDETPEHPGAVRIQRPRLVLNPGQNAVHIKDLKVLVNRRYDIASNTFTDIDGVFAPVDGTERTQAAVMSSGSLIAILDRGDTNALSISFEAISTTAQAPECVELNVFSTEVAPDLDRLCARCHTPVGASATGESVARLNLGLSPPEVCRRSKQSLHPRFITQSPLFTLPARGRFYHPTVAGMGDEALLARWGAWLDAER